MRNTFFHTNKDKQNRNAWSYVIHLYFAKESAYQCFKTEQLTFKAKYSLLKSEGVIKENVDYITL